MRLYPVLGIWRRVYGILSLNIFCMIDFKNFGFHALFLLCVWGVDDDWTLISEEKDVKDFSDHVVVP